MRVFATVKIPLTHFIRKRIMGGRIQAGLGVGKG